MTYANDDAHLDHGADFDAAAGFDVEAAPDAALDAAAEGAASDIAEDVAVDAVVAPVGAVVESNAPAAASDVLVPGPAKPAAGA